MRDGDIRGALLDKLTGRFPGDRICPEMGLCLGATRVDVAVVNGHLHGYEIKSERDTLARLDGQVQLYGQVLDYATIVASPKHLERVAELVPSWWGLLAATEKRDGDIRLREVRRARKNTTPDPLSIAQLLWRDEAAAVLEARGEQVKRTETRWILWDRLAALPLHELQSVVREQLKARPGWLAH